MGFSSVQNQGYFINVRNYIDNEENKNFFCGAHDIEGAFCPNCKKPLLRFMTIEVDGSVVKINKYPYKKIHFVYCWTCNLSQDIFYYQIVSDNKIEILKYKHGKEHDDFPYLDYPNYFPLGEISFDRLSPKKQKIIEELNSQIIDEFDLDEEDVKLCIPNHQLGGEPYLVQSELEDLFCPRCNSKMKFLAAICDQNLDLRGFVGNIYVQVIFNYCENCLVMSAIQQCG